MKQVQSLSPARKFLRRYLKRNKNATLKTLFKNTRKIQSISFIGDWPLINEIVFECAKKNIFYSSEEISKVFRSTDDPFLRTQRSDSKLVSILSSKEGLKSSIQARN